MDAFSNNTCTNIVYKAQEQESMRSRRSTRSNPAYAGCYVIEPIDDDKYVSSPEPQVTIKTEKPWKEDYQRKCCVESSQKSGLKNEFDTNSDTCECAESTCDCSGCFDSLSNINAESVCWGSEHSGSVLKDDKPNDEMESRSRNSDAGPHEGSETTSTALPFIILPEIKNKCHCENCPKKKKAVTCEIMLQRGTVTGPYKDQTDCLNTLARELSVHTRESEVPSIHLCSSQKDCNIEGWWLGGNLYCQATEDIPVDAVCNVWLCDPPDQTTSSELRSGAKQGPVTTTHSTTSCKCRMCGEIISDLIQVGPGASFTVCSVCIKQLLFATNRALSSPSLQVGYHQKRIPPKELTSEKTRNHDKSLNTGVNKLTPSGNGLEKDVTISLDLREFNSSTGMGRIYKRQTPVSQTNGSKRADSVVSQVGDCKVGSPISRPTLRWSGHQIKSKSSQEAPNNMPLTRAQKKTESSIGSHKCAETKPLSTRSSRSTKIQTPQNTESSKVIRKVKPGKKYLKLQCVLCWKNFPVPTMSLTSKPGMVICLNCMATIQPRHMSSQGPFEHKAAVKLSHAKASLVIEVKKKKDCSVKSKILNPDKVIDHQKSKLQQTPENVLTRGSYKQENRLLQFPDSSASSINQNRPHNHIGKNSMRRRLSLSEQHDSPTRHQVSLDTQNSTENTLAVNLTRKSPPKHARRGSEKDELKKLFAAVMGRRIRTPDPDSPVVPKKTATITEQSDKYKKETNCQACCGYLLLTKDQVTAHNNYHTARVYICPKLNGICPKYNKLSPTKCDSRGPGRLGRKRKRHTVDELSIDGETVISLKSSHCDDLWEHESNHSLTGTVEECLQILDDHIDTNSTAQPQQWSQSTQHISPVNGARVPDLSELWENDSLVTEGSTTGKVQECLQLLDEDIGDSDKPVADSGNQDDDGDSISGNTWETSSQSSTLQKVEGCLKFLDEDIGPCSTTLPGVTQNGAGYICLTCDERFNTESHLVAHRNLHTVRVRLERLPSCEVMCTERLGQQTQQRTTRHKQRSSRRVSSRR